MDKKKISDAQRAAQKKYDKKTKTISIKYTPADMKNYERMMSYLECTGKSINSFIKGLIDDFFNGTYNLTEKKIAEYFCEYNVSPEYLDKLKGILGSEEKYNDTLSAYAYSIENELSSAYEDKGGAFEEWVDNLQARIENGDVNIELNGFEFKKEILKSMSGYIKSVEYF